MNNTNNLPVCTLLILILSVIILCNLGLGPYKRRVLSQTNIVWSLTPRNVQSTPFPPTPLPYKTYNETKPM